MELKLKDMSYGLLLSHTFPGIFFGLEILTAFALFTPINLFKFIFSIENSLINLLSVLIIVFVSATLLGFILDGIHHCLFRKWELTGSDEDYKIYRVISNMEQMQMYKHFAEDDFWYPYEAFANISIAMIPGILLLPYGLYRIGIDLWFNITICVIYMIIFIIVLYEAKSTLDMFIKVEDALAQNFKERRVKTNHQNR